MNDNRLISCKSEDLVKNGWVLLTDKNQWNSEELIKLAFYLGTPILSREKGPLIDKLSPTPEKKAKPKSLSVVYGLREFPLHTDTAHWKIPARYIILHAKNPGSGCRPTLISDVKTFCMDDDFNDSISRGVFKVVNGRSSFLASIKENVDGLSFRIRYDRECMYPANSTAFKAIEKFNKIIDSTLPEIIYWSVGNVMIIDNWRVLHGRGLSLNDDQDRILERVLVR